MRDGADSDAKGIGCTMKNALIAVVGALANAVTVHAMETKSLDGLWKFRFERDKIMEEVSLPAFKADDRMVVPGAWNAMSRYYNEPVLQSAWYRLLPYFVHFGKRRG